MSKYKMGKVETYLIVLANILLWISMISRNWVCQYTAWFTWIAYLTLRIKQERKSKGMVIINSAFIILILAMLSYPFLKRL